MLTIQMANAFVDVVYFINGNLTLLLCYLFSICR